MDGIDADESAEVRVVDSGVGSVVSGLDVVDHALEAVGDDAPGIFWQAVRSERSDVATEGTDVVRLADVGRIIDGVRQREPGGVLMVAEGWPWLPSLGATGTRSRWGMAPVMAWPLAAAPPW